MAETAIPPAPWRPWGGDPLWYHLEAADGSYIGCIDRPSAMPLIAAAPDLLEAARGLLNLIGHGEGGPFRPDPAGTYNERVEALFAAIAKAEGRAP